MFFERISNNTFDCNNSEAEQFCSSYDFTEENFAFPELDCPITVDEILNAIKYLKRTLLNVVIYYLVIYMICSIVFCIQDFFLRNVLRVLKFHYIKRVRKMMLITIEE
jgi:hypothetical protein